MLSLSLGGNAMGLLLCAVVGHRLTALEYSQQRVEASLRTALVLTENETQKPAELHELQELFGGVRRNSMRLYRHLFYLETWVAAFDRCMGMPI